VCGWEVKERMPEIVATRKYSKCEPAHRAKRIFVRSSAAFLTDSAGSVTDCLQFIVFKRGKKPCRRQPSRLYTPIVSVKCLATRRSRESSSQLSGAKLESSSEFPPVLPTTMT